VFITRAFQEVLTASLGLSAYRIPSRRTKDRTNCPAASGLYVYCLCKRVGRPNAPSLKLVPAINMRPILSALQRWTSEDYLHSRMDPPRSCRLLVNFHSSEGGDLAWRVKPEITYLGDFLARSDGESTFREYTDACREASVLRTAMDDRLDPVRDCSVLRKGLTDQGMFLRDFASDYVLSVEVAICSTEYWETSGPTLCLLESGCTAQHHFEENEVRCSVPRPTNCHLSGCEQKRGDTDRPAGGA
jgi:hypothetical protein